jgi:hypothetical protein
MTNSVSMCFFSPQWNGSVTLLLASPPLFVCAVMVAFPDVQSGFQQARERTPMLAGLLPLAWSATSFKDPTAAALWWPSSAPLPAA